jgi:cytochrome c-type biogenesis protein CcmE
MKISSLIVLGLVLAGLILTVTAFVRNVSPYMSVAQVEEGATNVHVPLKPILNTVDLDIKTLTLTFEGEDETGRMKVVYPKGKPNNFEAATQVVVIGDYKQGVFHARDMLVKCPSKYNDGAKQASK